MPMSLKISGLDAMHTQLAVLEQEVSGSATRVSVRKAATVIKNEIVHETPVLDEKTAMSNALPPESLKNGMTISVKNIGEGQIMAIIGPGKLTYQVAHLVEYGHLIVKGGKLWVHRAMTGKGKVTGLVRAHPFIRPAFETSWREAIDAFIEAQKVQLAKWVK